MNYKVLYRKYRPSNFDELVGQDHIKKILKNSIIHDKIAHAYIFTGPRGTGKTSSAKIFARALNCLNPHDGISCGECENCLNFNSNPDIIELDAASNNGVENIRDIIENICIAPAVSKYKIYIIDEVHMLSTSAFNAFLKTLEEPPQNVIFILATTDIQKVTITVLSRCQRFDFQRIDRKLIFDNLVKICNEEDIKYTDDALNEVAYLSDGCMRDALSILDQLSKVSEEVNMDVILNNYGTVTSAQIDELYTAILKNDIDSLTKQIHSIKESGINIKIFSDKILDNFIEKAVNIKKKNVGSNAFNQIKKIINSLNDLLNKLNATSNGFLLLELELLSFINEDDNRLSNREIDKIISQEIISGSNINFDVNNMIVNKQNSSYYRMCQEFTDIRINNAFAGASKENKTNFINKWNDLKNYVSNVNKIELINIIKNSMPQVVSNTNVILVTPTESAKIVNNSKLHDLEFAFNNRCGVEYKMIFVSKKEWESLLSNFDKTKEYAYIDDSEFINDSNNSIKTAENIFGNNKINIE